LFLSEQRPFFCDVSVKKIFIFFVAVYLKQFQRTLVRRNCFKYTRLEYEVFYKYIFLITIQAQVNVK